MFILDDYIFTAVFALKHTSLVWISNRNGQGRRFPVERMDPNPIFPRPQQGTPLIFTQPKGNQLVIVHNEVAAGLRAPQKVQVKCK